LSLTTPYFILLCADAKISSAPSYLTPSNYVFCLCKRQSFTPMQKGKIRVLYVSTFPFLGLFTKSQKATISFVMSLHLSSRSHGTTQIPPNGFSCNLIFEYFLKICREKCKFNWHLTRITGTLLKTNIHLWSYTHLTQFFLEWEMFQTKVVEKSKHTLCLITFSRKSCHLWDNVE